MEYIEIERVDLGYYDPDTGRDLASIEGRKNRPGIDAFSHKGYDYPSLIKSNKCKNRIPIGGGKILAEIDITGIEADAFIIEEAGKNARKELDQVKIDNLMPTSGVTN